MGINLSTVAALVTRHTDQAIGTDEYGETSYIDLVSLPTRTYHRFQTDDSNLSVCRKWVSVGVRKPLAERLGLTPCVKCWKNS